MKAELPINLWPNAVQAYHRWIHTSLVENTRGQMVSNSVPFAVDALPSTAEKEPNDSGAAAQALTTPIIVNGRIERPGDADVFRIAGRPGAEVVAEIHARRPRPPSVARRTRPSAHPRRLRYGVTIFGL